MSETATAQPTVIRNERGLSIAGTRITLYHIMDYLEAGDSPEFIREDLDLTDQQINDVMTYIGEHRSEVEAEYRQVLEKAEETRRYWEERNRERFAQIAALPPTPEREALRAKIAENRRKRASRDHDPA
jgi:uncharacterized protein (DUF433 family)